MPSSSASPQTIYQSQSPRFQTDADPIAYAVHLAFVSAGFRLVGLDDQINAADQLYEGLPGIWNSTPGMYTFRYRQDQVVILVKCIAMDDEIVVCHANRSESDQIHTLDLFIHDHLRHPHHQLNDLNSVYSNLDDLVNLISERIVRDLKPPPPPPTARSWAAAYADRSYDYQDDDNDPLRVPGRRPIRPHGGDFDGDLGPRPIDPFRPESGGSYMGPDHPLFTRGRGGRGRGRIPRFDPFGPDRGFSGDPNRDLFMPPGFGGTGGHFPF